MTCVPDVRRFTLPLQSCLHANFVLTLSQCQIEIILLGAHTLQWSWSLLAAASDRFLMSNQVRDSDQKRGSSDLHDVLQGFILYRKLQSSCSFY
nr:uncharacterized protein LOC127344200 isoform X2 [Lolium perenne]